jgi:hypothetical protein
MGLTLNSNSLTLQSTGSAGGGGSSGLSEAQVNTIVQNKADWEFIRQDEITTTISSWTLTDGLDNDTFCEYKYSFSNLRPSGSAYYSVGIKREDGNNVNMAAAIHMMNTSYNFNGTTAQNPIYFYGSTSGLNSSARMFMEIEVQNYDRIQGFGKCGFTQPAGYWQHTSWGSFVCTSDTHRFGGIEIPSGFTQGKVVMYGRRIRSAS